ncbi:MAG: MFS transporter [Rhodospirillales bacterium]|nr:MFS transporter [Rhodospirillales bacterium]MSP80690.1 MFS transporter [Rhodospirillales bacterium]
MSESSAAFDPEVRRHARANALVLAVCQALAQGGAVLVIVVSALVGHELAENKALATVPFALQFVMTMLSTVPASLLMGRIGRRAGFTIGQTIGIIGACTAATAIYAGDFVLFATGSAILGIHNAFWQYYRFAAADTADEDFRPKAISYVMTGGLVAAFLGPEIAKLSRDGIAEAAFAGSYLALAGMCLVNIALLRMVRIPRPTTALFAGRPLGTIVRNPVFLVAAAAAMIGYASMSLVMTATPLAMHAEHFGFADTAFVIQWHVVGMYAPSFVTGHLIRRYSAPRVILVGTGLMIAAVAVNLSGQTLVHYWLGLGLIGMGWNFMFVGGTTLLTECYRPEERARVQALNDFLVFGTVAASSFTSGALQHGHGWAVVNFGIVMPILIVFAAAAWLLIHRRRLAQKTA